MADESRHCEESRNCLVKSFSLAHNSSDVQLFANSLKSLSDNEERTNCEILDCCRDGEGQCALHFACHGVNESVVKFIVETSPKLVWCGDKSGKTALMVAAQQGSLRVCQLILESVESDEESQKLVNLANNEQCTALHYSCEYGNPEVVKFLLTKGAEKDHMAKKTGTALHWAIVHKKHEALNVLIEDGHINCDLTQLPMPPPLVLACSMPPQGNHTTAATTAALLRAGANVNACDADGWTALQCAAETGNAEVVNTLLDWNADPSIVTKSRTAYDLAHENRQLKVVELFESKGHNILGGGAAVRLPTAPQTGNAEERSEGSGGELGDEIPNQAEQLKAEGNSCVAKKEFESALGYYRKAVSLLSEVPNSEMVEGRIKLLRASMHANNSHCLLNCTPPRPADALSEAREAVVWAPDWHKAFYRLAVAETAMGNLEEATQLMFSAYNKCNIDQSSQRVFYLKEFQKSLEAAKLEHKVKIMREDEQRSPPTASG